MRQVAASFLLCLLLMASFETCVDAASKPTWPGSSCLTGVQPPYHPAQTDNCAPLCQCQCCAVVSSKSFLSYALSTRLSVVAVYNILAVQGPIFQPMDIWHPPQL